VAAHTPAACTWRRVRVSGALAAAGGRDQADSVGAHVECMHFVDGQRRHVLQRTVPGYVSGCQGASRGGRPGSGKLGWCTEVIAPRFNCVAALPAGLLTTAHPSSMRVPAEAAWAGAPLVHDQGAPGHHRQHLGALAQRLYGEGHIPARAQCDAGRARTAMQLLRHIQDDRPTALTQFTEVHVTQTAAVRTHPTHWAGATRRYNKVAWQTVPGKHHAFLCIDRIA